MAADVFADFARRLSARLEIGTRRRNSFADCELSDNACFRKSYARCREIAVYDCRACGFCLGFGNVFREDSRARLDGFSCGVDCGSPRTLCLSRFGGNISKRVAVVRVYGLDAGSNGFNRFVAASGSRARARNGFVCGNRPRKKIAVFDTILNG